MSRNYEEICLPWESHKPLHVEDFKFPIISESKDGFLILKFGHPVYCGALIKLDEPNRDMDVITSDTFKGE